MITRPSFETIESLRRTLQKLQETSDTVEGVASMADLKRILLNRIAEIEVTMALAPAAAEAAKISDPSALIPPSLAGTDSSKKTAATTELAQLD
jgi:hypothetical protein